MDLSEHIKNVCRIGQGIACCRYLTVGQNGWNCEKHTGLQFLLDERVRKKTITARGDNCEGKSTEFLNKPIP